MKILLYTEGLSWNNKSGLGKAVRHQIKALEDNHVPYTTDVHEKDYDIAHINFWGPRSYCLAKKAKRKGKKVVYHAHSTEEDFRNSFILSNQLAPFVKWWLCKCYRLGDYVITPTEYSQKLLEGYHLNRPIAAISNGIDLDFFKRDEKKGQSFRKTYGYTKEDKVVIGIGLYLKRKGLLTFVEMAKRLPEYQFIWFGYSPLSAAPKEIKDAVHTKLDNLKFAGYVEPDMIVSAFSGCDLYVFPTLEETEGIPILEALATKTPALIRDIPIFDFLEDGKEVYKAKNDDEFAEKISDILKGNLPSLVENGYPKAEEKEIQKVGKQLVEIYKKVLEESK